MARCFPSRVGGVSREVALAFRLLRKLPDEFQVWFSLGGRNDEGPPPPHCFVLHDSGAGALVQVSSATQRQAEGALQSELFAGEDALRLEDVGRAEGVVLGRFSRALRETYGAEIALRQLVVFPRVKRLTIGAIEEESRVGELALLGLVGTDPAAVAEALEAGGRSFLDPACLNHLRFAFTPEVVVPARFSPLVLGARNTAAELADGLLDFDQEWAMKHDLHPPHEVADAVSGETDAGRHSLVTGVAGSGKSLVLLYRALLIARREPGARVLVLTHNRGLRFELEARARTLGHLPANLTFRTFFQWARDQLDGTDDWPSGDIIPVPATERILAQMLHAQPSATGLTASFLSAEIAWIKDQNLRRRGDYLEIERAGRGAALQSTARDEVWTIFKRYQQQLQAEGKADWHGVAMRFHQVAADGGLAFPAFDHILIDEAQFFAKAWFDVVLAALDPAGQLFLAADPTQGFLRRRQSWLASGIDVRGRTTRLKRPYRNARAILRFAAAFFQSRGQGDDGGEELNVPTAEQIASVPVEGSPPEVVRCANERDVFSRTANELVALREGGLPAGRVLVLLANSAAGNALRRELGEALGSDTLVHDAKSGRRPPEAFCQINTLNATTGLEAPVVFLLGAERLLDRESDPTLSADERGELRRDHTRQLFMAFTRAGQRLVVITRGDKLAADLLATGHCK